jgi:hypothetical protein
MESGRVVRVMSGHIDAIKRMRMVVGMLLAAGLVSMMIVMLFVKVSVLAVAFTGFSADFVTGKQWMHLPDWVTNVPGMDDTMKGVLDLLRQY